MNIQLCDNQLYKDWCKAIIEGDVPQVRILLPSITDVDAKIVNETTPLCKASQDGNLELVQTLLDCLTIDVNKPNKFGQTALQLAAEKGHTLVVMALLKKPKTDINARDKWGRSPLYLAARAGHIEIVKAFVHDLRILITASIFKIATKNNRTEVMQLIKQHMRLPLFILTYAKHHRLGEQSAASLLPFDGSIQRIIFSMLKEQGPS
jgi:ankyrin repeat protein